MLLRHPSLRRAIAVALKPRFFSSSPTPFGLPALSPSMENGRIVSWSKNVGDRIDIGDVICEIETDKATVAYEANEEGYLAAQLVGAGNDEIPVGSIIGLIVEEEDEVTGAMDAYSKVAKTEAPEASTTGPSNADTAPTSAPVQTSTPSQQTFSGPRVDTYSPAVGHLLRLHNIDPLSINPTGSGLSAGRLTKGDVLTAIKNDTAKKLPTVAANNTSTPATNNAPTTTAPPTNGARADRRTYEDIPVTNMRKVIASRLGESKRVVPHHYASIDCEMDTLLSFRKRMKDEFQMGSSVNDFIIRASAIALDTVPALNVTYNDKTDSVIQSPTIDISVAVATPSGLITPIVKNANYKRLTEISSTVRDLATRARDNALLPDEFMGGSFTISNLGMFGISDFKAVINKPQACILAVSSTQGKVVPKEDEEGVEMKSFMTVTLSCDERCVDSAQASEWLTVFKGLIENPQKMIF